MVMTTKRLAGIALLAVLVLCLLTPGVHSNSINVVGALNESNASPLSTKNTHNVNGEDHRSLQQQNDPHWTYQLPSWWSVVNSNFPAGSAFPDVNLKRCYKRQYPPLPGTLCATSAKTCFFGNQECPSGPYPTQRCFCSGVPSSYQFTPQTWYCEDAQCPPTDIACRVIQDVNFSNDNNEFPLAGVAIALIDESATTIVTTVTDSSGDCGLTDVPIGDYTLVSKMDLPGFFDVSDSDGGDPASISITVPWTGTGPESNVFVVAQTPSISGFVLEDTDGSRSIGITNVLITVSDESGSVFGTTLTDSSGSFFFGSILPGIYLITETDLPGWTSVTDSDGGDPNIIIGDTLASPVSGIIFVDQPPSGPSPTPAIDTYPVNGRMLVDYDNDAMGDAGLPGVAITLIGTSSGGAAIPTTITDSSGNFGWTDVPIGDYNLVREMNIPGYFDVSDSDGGDPASISITVPWTGTGPESNVFVVAQTPSISGFVLEDTDGSRSIGITNVLITVSDESGSVFGTTLTDSDGSFFFAYLPLGIYLVTETDLPGWTSVTDTDGSDPNIFTADISAFLPNGIIFVDQLQEI